MAPRQCRAPFMNEIKRLSGWISFLAKWFNRTCVSSDSTEKDVEKTSRRAGGDPTVEWQLWGRPRCEEIPNIFNLLTKKRGVFFTSLKCILSFILYRRIDETTPNYGDYIHTGCSHLGLPSHFGLHFLNWSIFQLIWCNFYSITCCVTPRNSTLFSLSRFFFAFSTSSR